MITRQVKIRPWVPSPDQQMLLRETEATMQWLWDLPDALRNQYAGQWVAAQDCRIVASAPTMAELCDRLANPADPTIIMERFEKGVAVR